MTALSGWYICLSSREVRPSTSTRVWLGGDTRRRPPVDSPGCPRLVKVQERAWDASSD